MNAGECTCDGVNKIKTAGIVFYLSLRNIYLRFKLIAQYSVYHGFTAELALCEPIGPFKILYILCSLGPHFSSAHTISTILGLLERSPREEEIDDTDGDHNAISPTAESSEIAKMACNACNFFLLQPFHFSQSQSFDFFTVDSWKYYP